MDGQEFDRFTRMLASGMSRRDAVRALAAGVGATALTAVGLTTALSNVSAAGKVRLSKSPSVKFDGFTAVITLQTSESAFVVVEYGKSKAFGSQVASDKASRTHTMTLPDLSPKTRYSYRVQMQAETTTATSKTYTIQSPSCPRATVLCGGACVPKCVARTILDEATCGCTCPAGYGDCDGDPSNGCETKLNTIENCLGCGINCDDGNACTVNTCDRRDGCQTANLADGTPCGTDGVCTNGECLSCVAGGACQADADCCDDELCCGGACVARAVLLDDVDNCGSCGNACTAATCQTAICVDGSCQSVPGAEQDPCDDGNPCTENDHCMSGACMGNPIVDGAPCGEGGTCHEGMCVVCTPGNTCSADSDCCASEGCCGGACVELATFASDASNCGACGSICANEEICQQAICAVGVCGATAIADDVPCEDDNPCMENPACRDGACVGTPLADGTPCNTDGICQTGDCIAPDMVAPGGVGPIFEDDFETGRLSKWSATSGMEVQTSIVAAGSYAARATGSGATAYARKTISPVQTDLYLRTRIQVISQGSNSVHLLRTFTSSSSPLFSVLVDSAGRLATYNNVTRATTTSSNVLTMKNWHEVQLRVKIAGTSSLVEVWLNGSKLAELSKTVDLGTTGISTAQIGETATGRTYDLAFDDVAICVGGLCPSPGTVTPPAGGGTSTAPGAANAVLLATYAFNTTTGAGVNWAKVVYRPRQFKSGLVYDDPSWGTRKVDNAGAYEGWDFFPTYNYSVHRVETRSDWTVLEANRATTLAIVWRGGSIVPTWLSAWEKTTDVVIGGKTFPTFQKKFGAGKVTLGAVYNPADSPGNVTRDTYWVLLAETDGLPSPAPSVPSGTGVPTPNATCPAWVHDQYVTTGPDGKTYPTWHHQIDPVYWCYHRHEHGSNPYWFSSDKKPAFGYTAAKHGMNEPHAGFKNFVFDSNDGTRWMVTHHFGTAGLARACVRFHTVDLVVRSIATSELLADLHFMGDFGKSVINRTQEIITPPTCPDQATLATGSTGIRMLPAQSADSVGYEPWRIDLKKTSFGFVADFTVNNPDPMVICNNATCDQAVSTGQSGTFRFFTANQSSLNQPFGITAGSNTGTFYTDPLGTKQVTSSDPGAVRQYIKPGIKIQAIVSGHCYDVYAWGKKLICGANSGNATNREGSIQPPN